MSVTLGSTLSHASWITAGGNLLAFGYNEYGQLGLGTVGNVTVPTEVTSLASFNIAKVVAGYKHTVVITKEGHAYVMGSNECGQLGLGHKEQQVRPQRLPLPHNVVIVSAAVGSLHTLLLDSEGRVYVMGSNELGQLGLGDNEAPVTTPCQLEALAKKKIVKIVAGYEHSAALSADGQVFTWGNNHAGQLGLGNVFNQDTPQIVSALALSKVVDIESGYAQLFALTDDGALYVCGLNVKGQLGLGHSTNPIASPAKLNLPGPVAAVASGNAHAVVLLRDGRVFGFGLNGYGELGIDGVPVVTAPRELTWASSLGVSQIVTGWQHNLVLTRGGDVYAWGRGDYGQLGAKKAFVKTPTKIEGLGRVDSIYLLRGVVTARSGVVDTSVLEEAVTLQMPERPGGSVTITAHQHEDLVGPGQDATVTFKY